MAAYPLLLALPHRFQIPSASAPPRKKTEPLIQERVQYSVSPQVFRSILSIGAQKSFPEVCQTMTQTIAEAMLADICLALLPPDRDRQITIQSGYDLILQKEIQGRAFEGHEVPLLLSAMERSLPLRLPASSTSRDLFSLGSKLQLGRAGHLLAAFVTGNDQNPILGIILLSPYSNRGWSKDDQKFLTDITKGLAQILQRNHQWRSLQNEVTKNRQNLKTFQAMLEKAQNENAELRSELSDLTQPSLQEQGATVAPPPDILQESSEKIKRLQAENLRLEELVEKLLTEREVQPEAPGLESLEEELHLAIGEITQLKSRLAAADKDLLDLHDGSIATPELSDHRIEVFTSIAQELRQPMSSIIGYTDLLLGESIGILGASQRKFLERVRASTERMQVLLDDLFQVVSMEGNQLELKPEMTDLGNIIDEAILATTNQLRDRHIILRVDLPDQLPQLQADRDALGQVFFHLLKNAGDASPIEGEVLLRASTYQTDDNQQYILIQVADQGGGIPTHDLPRVFSRSYRADNPLIEGVGDTGVGLSIAKTLVEAHNGRIWVDTEVGKGSTFSVLIPLLNGDPGERSL
jgi:signal transduction histidine kinase